MWALGFGGHLLPLGADGSPGKAVERGPWLEASLTVVCDSTIAEVHRGPSQHASAVGHRFGVTAPTGGRRPAAAAHAHLIRYR